MGGKTSQQEGMEMVWPNVCCFFLAGNSSDDAKTYTAVGGSLPCHPGPGFIL